eukprot:CAMPEP_0201616016 /NCGR_PEP_ID=MMETSP0492-20130828/32848_1 /ASSEMBLY_ACC=CAM_ASM_000837 /TAXON_ID=420259 /ORGANISM="Thalassiosira gravida, Strain GMp14c1" /LENGTH=70 /DNA_ID=CAMNT_0048083859 /DNA_START=306 /DNA_END=518 /DNA_ORIENTATION=+
MHSSLCHTNTCTDTDTAAATATATTAITDTGIAPDVDHVIAPVIAPLTTFFSKPLKRPSNGTKTSVIPSI